MTDVSRTVDPADDDTWVVKPGEPGLFHVARVNGNGDVVQWHTVTYTSEQSAHDKADELNAS